MTHLSALRTPAYAVVVLNDFIDLLFQPRRNLIGSETFVVTVGLIGIEEPLVLVLIVIILLWHGECPFIASLAHAEEVESRLEYKLELGFLFQQVQGSGFLLSVTWTSHKRRGKGSTPQGSSGVETS